MKQLLLSTAMLVLSTACTTNALARGVAAIKTASDQPDASAKPFIFERITQSPRHLRFDIKGKQPFTMPKSPRVEWVEILPRFHKNISNDSSIAPYEKSLKECLAFTTKYTQVKHLLTAYMKILEDDIKKYEEGLVKHNDKWMSKEE